MIQIYVILCIPDPGIFQKIEHSGPICLLCVPAMWHWQSAELEQCQKGQFVLCSLHQSAESNVTGPVSEFVLRGLHQSGRANTVGS
jgi:hypothetical protein